MTREPAFDDGDAQVAWDAGADAWSAFVESSGDYYRHEVHSPALLQACGPLRGKRILDLGCGQGYFSRELARRGATVIAVDVADALLERARELEEREPLGIEYRKLSAAAIGEAWPHESFDLVISCVSLQDMADVPRVLKGAFVVLRAAGAMLASIPHPATDMKFREWERNEAGGKLYLKLDRYFESGPTECHWNMPRLKYHWSTPCWRFTLEEWSSLIAEAGFGIRRLLEPRPTAEQVVANPDLDDCYRMPFFLILDLWKGASTPATANEFGT